MGILSHKSGNVAGLDPSRKHEISKEYEATCRGCAVYNSCHPALPPDLTVYSVDNEILETLGVKAGSEECELPKQGERIIEI